MKKLFVWDLHGVLEKGNDHAVVEITNLILKQFNYTRRLSTQESYSLSGKKWYEYFTYLLPKEPHEEHLKLQSASFAYSQANTHIISKHIQPNYHSHDVLSAIQKSPHDQILISNTKAEALAEYLKILDLERFFPLSYHFAVDAHTQQKQTKHDILKAFLKKKEYPGGIVTIGDSSGDIALVEDTTKPLSYLHQPPHRTPRQNAADHKINDLRVILEEVYRRA